MLFTMSICIQFPLHPPRYQAITRVAKTYNFSVVKSYCGHGVGRQFHCAPNVPHYAQNKAVGFMRVG